MKQPAIFIGNDSAVLMQEAVQRILDLHNEAIQARGVFHMALSGGNTPNAMFRRMAARQYAGQFDWSRTHLWWSDERYLPPDSPDCNYNMAYDALIGRIAIPAANLHRVQVQLPADDAAAQYEADIVKLVGLVSDTALPAFDLVMLGLGDDGHTASLFPGTLARIPPDKLVIAHYVEKAAMVRITFTPRLINAARHVSFLVSGTAKREILARVLHGPHEPDSLPSQIIAPVNGELTWLVDRDAAGA
ncbi:MAG: 6-phosphogluconolactonase [Chloroflexi bacterium]|nr:6-phosphogluconolactonase [Chloroflexota bacterium]MCL5276028.1 6-phosphogluconolactonase [Chloroflexota bacterium]